MPFDRGTFATTFFKLPNDLPENVLELFNSNSASKLDEVKDEPQVGWVSGRHLLERRIDLLMFILIPAFFISSLIIGNIFS